MTIHGSITCVCPECNTSRVFDRAGSKEGVALLRCQECGNSYTHANLCLGKDLQKDEIRKARKIEART